MSASPSESESESGRWNEIGVELASRLPAILFATIALLDAVIEVVDAREAAAGAALKAKHVLHAARVHGIGVFTGKPDNAVLLGTIPWLDLTDPGIRAQLLELRRRGEIRLVQVGPAIMDHARDDLANRGERPELIEHSAIVDGNETYHAVLV